MLATLVVTAVVAGTPLPPTVTKIQPPEGKCDLVAQLSAESLAAKLAGFEGRVLRREPRGWSVVDTKTGHVESQFRCE